MMERDQRAELALRIAMAKDLERTAGMVTGANLRSFLDGSDEIWIERETGSSQWHERNRGRIVWRRRKHARRCPGRFLHQFLAVEHRDPQISPRQFKSDGAANDAATHDDDVERFHDIILAAKAGGATAPDGVTSAISQVHWKERPLSPPDSAREPSRQQ
jgi:hypothetical protein